jgi:hypothetical protein
MNDRMEHGRAERLSALAAVEAALADPVRLVELLQEAGDDADVVRRVPTRSASTPSRRKASSPSSSRG